MTVRELSLGVIERLPHGTIIVDKHGNEWTVDSPTVDGRVLTDSEGLPWIAGAAIVACGPFSTLPMVSEIPDENARHLAARLMLANAQDNLSVATSLMESYRRSAERAEAALRIIRDRIADLCNGPFAPNTRHVYNALWPTDDEISELVGDES